MDGGEPPLPGHHHQDSPPCNGQAQGQNEQPLEDSLSQRTNPKLNGNKAASKNMKIISLTNTMILSFKVQTGKTFVFYLLIHKLRKMVKRKQYLMIESNTASYACFLAKEALFKCNFLRGQCTEF